MAGEITGGDLYHLWRVAAVHLPRVADVYYDATRVLGGARTTVTPIPGAPSHIAPEITNDSDGFRQNKPAYPGAATAMTSSVGTAWAALRDELMNMYAQIGGTVLAGANGVSAAMQAFVDADMVNADALDKYKADPNNHDPNKPESNPPAPGSAEEPGTPVLPN